MPEVAVSTRFVSGTRGLALDMAPIRVNAVCAGVIKTALWSGVTEADREAMYAERAKSPPVGRVGEWIEVADPSSTC